MRASFTTGLAIAMLALGAPGCLMQLQDPLAPGDPTDGNVRFITFNVGNPDGDDPHYPLRLRDQAYEDFVRDAIASWRPDVIALQEVLPPHTCGSFVETDERRTCFEHALRAPAVRRLLGPDYSIACDARRQVECVGVHIAFGNIVGVEPGGLELMGAETPALPRRACEYSAGECREDLCDAESTVSAIDVDSIQGPLRVVHMHPNASGLTGDGIPYVGTPCRVDQTEQGFALATEGVPTLMLGDWNFDPDNTVLYRAEAEVWRRFVGSDRRFADHGQRDGLGRRVTTTHDDPGGFAIDHVITDFAEGDCQVVRPRFDEDFDFSTLGEGSDAGRIDHRPVLCDLYWL